MGRGRGRSVLLAPGPTWYAEAVKVGRRGVLSGIAALGAAVAAGWAGRRYHAANVARDVTALCARSHEALRAGGIHAAQSAAEEALALAPDSRLAAMALVEAGAVALVDGDAGAAAGVALVERARVLGATGAELALVTLAAAVATRNDRLALRIVQQHDEQKLGGGGVYELVAGAALDLACEPATARYERSASLWIGAIAPRVRLVRAWLFEGRLDEARAALADVDAERPERKVLEAAVARLEGPRVIRSPGIAAHLVGDLPRSLRSLATALSVGEDAQGTGIEAALDDVDGPLAAELCGRLALAGGDPVSAAAAASFALGARPEFGRAASLAARASLAMGQLDAAQARVGVDAATGRLVLAVAAYEAGDLARLDEALAGGSAGADWSLVEAARGLLGRGPRPTAASLLEAIGRGAPWARELAVDLALLEGDAGRAEGLLAGAPAVDAPAVARRRERARKPAVP